MNKKNTLLYNQEDALATDTPSIIRGEILTVTEEGLPIIKFKGSPSTGVCASIGLPSRELGSIEKMSGLPVLILLPDDPLQKPIIIGVIRDSLLPSQSLIPPVAEKTANSLTINGKSLLLEGENEVVLKCGLGSITLRANGQIVIKGTKLLSRASEANKIRGASVLIN